MALYDPHDPSWTPPSPCYLVKGFFEGFVAPVSSYIYPTEIGRHISWADFDTRPDSAGGLWGLLNGNGDHRHYAGCVDFMIFDLGPNGPVVRGHGKVKVMGGHIAYAGDREGAQRWLIEHGVTHSMTHEMEKVPPQVRTGPSVPMLQKNQPVRNATIPTGASLPRASRNAVIAPAGPTAGQLWAGYARAIGRGVRAVWRTYVSAAAWCVLSLRAARLNRKVKSAGLKWYQRAEPLPLVTSPIRDLTPDKVDSELWAMIDKTSKVGGEDTR